MLHQCGHRPLDSNARHSARLPVPHEHLAHQWISTSVAQSYHQSHEEIVAPFSLEGDTLKSQLMKRYAVVKLNYIIYMFQNLRWKNTKSKTRYKLYINVILITFSRSSSPTPSNGSKCLKGSDPPSATASPVDVENIQWYMYM